MRKIEQILEDIGGQNPVNTTMNRNNYAEISEKKS